jgi:uncharacterized membrane protein YoaK (UPF0700 family)
MRDRREEPAPRRAGDVREERAADRERQEAELGTSWISVILGWLAALGASLILSGIVGAIVGGILAPSASEKALRVAAFPGLSACS